MQYYLYLQHYLVVVSDFTNLQYFVVLATLRLVFFEPFKKVIALQKI